MHSHGRPELCSQVGAIGGVIDISVGDHDQPKVARSATSLHQSLLKIGALVPHAGIYQDEPVVGREQIGVDEAEIDGLRL